MRLDRFTQDLKDYLMLQGPKFLKRGFTPDEHYAIQTIRVEKTDKGFTLEMKPTGREFRDFVHEMIDANVIASFYRGG